MPLLKANAHTDYKIGDWEFDLDIHYVSGSKMPDLTQNINSPTRGLSNVGDYVIFNPRVGYHWDKIFTQLSIVGPDHRELPNSKTGTLVLFSITGKL